VRRQYRGTKSSFNHGDASRAAFADFLVKALIESVKRSLAGSMTRPHFGKIGHFRGLAPGVPAKVVFEAKRPG